MSAACLIRLGLCAAVALLLAPAGATLAAPASQTSVVSPEIGADRRVTFRLAAPDAARVHVVVAASPTALAGGGGLALAMRREGAVWSARSEPLAPDIYAYQFVAAGALPA